MHLRSFSLTSHSHKKLYSGIQSELIRKSSCVNTSESWNHRMKDVTSGVTSGDLKQFPINIKRVDEWTNPTDYWESGQCLNELILHLLWTNFGFITYCGWFNSCCHFTVLKSIKKNNRRTGYCIDWTEWFKCCKAQTLPVQAAGIKKHK